MGIEGVSRRSRRYPSLLAYRGDFSNYPKEDRMKIVVFTILLAVVVEWGEAGFKSKTLKMTCPSGTNWFGKIGNAPGTAGGSRRVIVACCKPGARLVLDGAYSRCCPTSSPDKMQCTGSGCWSPKIPSALGGRGTAGNEVQCTNTFQPGLKKTAEVPWDASIEQLEEI